MIDVYEGKVGPVSHTWSWSLVKSAGRYLAWAFDTVSAAAVSSGCGYTGAST